MPKRGIPKKARDHIKLICPKCGTMITVTRRPGIRSAKCPGKGCGERIRIPKR